MNLDIVTAIAGKDLRQILGRRTVRTSLTIFPLIVAVGLPLILRFGGRKTGGIPAAVIPQMLDAFTVLFVIGAAVLPTFIASYSLVGEKVERSLEPLLATPASDGEVLAGKSAAALAPPLAVMWGAAIVFMVLSDFVTRGRLGYDYFPTGSSLVTFLLVVPLSAVMSVQFSVLVSARVTDVRAAQQLSSLIVLPFAALYLLSELKVVTLDGAAVAVVCIVVAVVDVVLFLLAKATFRREEILTRWK